MDHKKFITYINSFLGYNRHNGITLVELEEGHSVVEVKLNFDDSVLEAIVKKAMERDTGARALRAIIEEFMLDIMYEIPKDDNIGEVTITGDYINGTGGPVIEIRKDNVHAKQPVQVEVSEKKQETAEPKTNDNGPEKVEKHDFYEF